MEIMREMLEEKYAKFIFICNKVVCKKIKFSISFLNLFPPLSDGRKVVKQTSKNYMHIHKNNKHTSEKKKIGMRNEN